MRWIEAVEVESRKVDAALLRHGIQPYDAVISSPYNPALHERVGSKRVEGMGPLWSPNSPSAATPASSPSSSLRRPEGDRLGITRTNPESHREHRDEEKNEKDELRR